MLRYIYKYINPWRWQVGVKIDKVVKVKKKKKKYIKIHLCYKRNWEKNEKKCYWCCFYYQVRFHKKNARFELIWWWGIYFNLIYQTTHIVWVLKIALAPLAYIINIKKYVIASIDKWMCEMCIVRIKMCTIFKYFSTYRA